MDIGELRQMLDRAGQAHVLNFWDELDSEQQRELQAELQALNVEELNVVFRKAMDSFQQAARHEKVDARMEPVPRQVLGSATRDQDQLQAWESEGSSLAQALTARCFLGASCRPRVSISSTLPDARGRCQPWSSRSAALLTCPSLPAWFFWAGACSILPPCRQPVPSVCHVLSLGAPIWTPVLHVGVIVWLSICLSIHFCCLLRRRPLLFLGFSSCSFTLQNSLSSHRLLSPASVSPCFPWPISWEWIRTHRVPKMPLGPASRRGHRKRFTPFSSLPLSFPLCLFFPPSLLHLPSTWGTIRGGPVRPRAGHTYYLSSMSGHFSLWSMLSLT